MKVKLSNMEFYAFEVGKISILLRKTAQNIRKGMLIKMMLRKTKIICTLGPSTDDEGVLRHLMLGGMNAARFNFSHCTHEEAARKMEVVSRLRTELDLPIATILDTKGPEIRLKTFAQGKVQLQKGQLFTLSVTDEPGDENGCGISYERLYQDVAPGGAILLDDGLIGLTVEEIRGTDIICRVLNSGAVSNRKGVNLPGVRFSMPYLSPKDEADLLFAIRNDYDFIAASFVRRADDVMQIRRVLRENASDIEIIAKIENAEGVENIDEILAVADGVMVARGDMGVEIPFDKLPAIQKMMIKKANSQGKIVITATQMLDSMIKNPRPTRAEVSDVANAVYDGTGAIMLSGETAAGQYPVESVAAMAAIAQSTEENINYAHRLRQEEPGPVPNVTSSISYATCTTASSLGCAAIIPVSKTGRTARMISRFRPQVPIVCCTNSVRSQRRLSLVWGVYPLVTEECDSTDALFESAIGAAQRAGMVKDGDLVVLTAGLPLGVSGTTNLLKVEVIGHLLVSGSGVGAHSATGPVVICKNAQEALENLRQGDILVAPYTTHEMLPAIRRCGGLITEQSGLDSHAATAALALDIPAVVGATGACQLLKSGACVTVDAACGTVCGATKES